MPGLSQLHQFPMSAQAGEELPRKKRVLSKGECTGTQRIKGGKKVSAVDRGDETLVAEGFERLRVIPVVQMSPMLFHPRNRAKTAFGQIDKLGHRQESEFARGLTRVEQKADVGGRHSCSFVETFLFHVVGDEIVVTRSSKLVEVAPNAQCMVRQKALVGGAKTRLLLRRWSVKPARHCVGKTPNEKNRCSHI